MTTLENLRSRYDDDTVLVLESICKKVDEWLAVLPAEARNDRPAVNLSDRFGVEVEWWCGERSLTVSFDDTHVTYLKAWGANVDTEMDDGAVATADDLRPLWAWLEGAR